MFCASKLLFCFSSSSRISRSRSNSFQLLPTQECVSAINKRHRDSLLRLTAFPSLYTVRSNRYIFDKIWIVMKYEMRMWIIIKYFRKGIILDPKKKDGKKETLHFYIFLFQDPDSFLCLQYSASTPSMHLLTRNRPAISLFLELQTHD